MNDCPDVDATSSNAGKAEPRRDAVVAMIAGFLGWTLDAFDFFLVVIALPRIAADFSVDQSVIAASLLLTLAFRPVGAFIFGLLADRYGRRVPMMANLVFFSVIELATAFAPNLATFMVLRALFGIGMGGEWGVGASLVMEKVSARWRGALSGLLQEGYAVGYLLAAVAAYFMLKPYGWRPMFILGGLPALLAIYIRFGVKESAVWQRSKAESWSHLGRRIAAHWKLWIYLTLLMTMMNLSSHGTQDVYPAFMKDCRGLDEQAYSQVVIVMMLGAIFGGAVFGFASDRFGRRAMIVLSYLGALAFVPFWAFSSNVGRIAAAAFLMQFMVQGAWGIVPAHLNEMSPDEARGFLPGFSYQCGNLLAAWIGWGQSKLAERFDYPRVMAVSAAACFLAAIAMTALGAERRGIEFGASKPDDPSGGA